jgi:5-methylcytosine-specific restriction protein A
MPESAKIFGKSDREPRGSASARGYNARWRRASKAFLREPENILCIDCKAEGKEVFATEVDHEIPHRGDQELFWDQTNWRPRCKVHHSRKTARGG